MYFSEITDWSCKMECCFEGKRNKIAKAVRKLEKCWCILRLKSQFIKLPSRNHKVTLGKHREQRNVGCGDKYSLCVCGCSLGCHKPWHLTQSEVERDSVTITVVHRSEKFGDGHQTNTANIGGNKAKLYCYNFPFRLPYDIEKKKKRKRFPVITDSPPTPF